jgi:hypothetical protein
MSGPDRWWLAAFLGSALLGAAAGRMGRNRHSPAIPSIFQGWRRANPSTPVRQTTVHLGADPADWSFWTKLGNAAESAFRDPLSPAGGAMLASIEAVDLPYLSKALPQYFDPLAFTSVIHLLRNSPRDPRGWIILGLILELDGQARAAQAAYGRGLVHRKEFPRLTLTGALYWTALLRALWWRDGVRLADPFFAEIDTSYDPQVVSFSIVQALGTESPALVEQLLTRWRALVSEPGYALGGLLEYYRNDLGRYDAAAEMAIAVARAAPSTFKKGAPVGAINSLLQRGHLAAAEAAAKDLAFRPDELTNLDWLVRVRENAVAGVAPLVPFSGDVPLLHFTCFLLLEVGELQGAKRAYQLLVQRFGNKLSRLQEEGHLLLGMELLARMPGANLEILPLTTESFPFWEDVTGALSTPLGAYWMNRLLTYASPFFIDRHRLPLVRALWYARRNLPQMARLDLATVLSAGAYFPRRVAVEVLARGLWSKDLRIRQETQDFIRSLDWPIPRRGLSELQYLDALMRGNEVEAGAIATHIFERFPSGFWGLAAARGALAAGKRAEAESWEPRLRTIARLRSKGLWILDELKLLLEKPNRS